MAGGSFDELRAEYRETVQRCFRVDDPAELARAARGRLEAGGSKCAVDQALRDALLELVAKGRGADAQVERFVSFCVACCRLDAATPTMPVVLLGDAFDANPLDACERMFAYVERNVDVWKEELFFHACKNNLLRMCNDLLRRLSREQNTVFCGRILLFLAKFFPFSERSGLNIVSEFNSENVTELGDREPDADPSPVVDYNLYCKFWALQDYFRNPNLCYNRVQWKTFASHSSAVLSAFGSYKLDAERAEESRPPARSPSEARETRYFAKFLTNQKLLELQLSDSNFRRCVLVQYLILFQYLLSSVKFKMDIYDLKAEQVEWVKETTDLVYALASETPPDGPEFAERVRKTLEREDLWNNWKNDGCPEFQKLKAVPAAEIPDGEESRRLLRPRRKRLLGDIVRDYETQGKYYMGNNELTKLWNLCPDNLEACKGKDRDFLPSIETYLSEAFDQAERGVQGEERVVADENFGWRALRLLASRSPHFFTYSSNLINRLPDYLETMIKKIAKDLAASKRTDQDPGEGEISEEQMEADLMKGGDPNDVEQNQDAEMQSCENPDFEDEQKSSQAKILTEEQMMILCKKLDPDWKRLAAKLGFKDDEILFFKENSPTNALRASKMLEIYFQEEDASVENLAYVLEGLGLTDAASYLKEPEI